MGWGGGSGEVEVGWWGWMDPPEPPDLATYQPDK